MDLNVPYVRQPPGLGWCGGASATMVLKFSGKKVSLKRVAQELRIGPTGITTPHLASYFLKYGLDVAVQVWPHGMIDDFCSKKRLNGEIAIETLKRAVECGIRGKGRKWCEESGALVRRGGSVIFHPITLDDLREQITSGFPIIIGIDWKYLLPTDFPRKVGHFVVIYGITDPDSRVKEPCAHVHDPAVGPNLTIPVRMIIGACDNLPGSVIYTKPKAVR